VPVRDGLGRVVRHALTRSPAAGCPGGPTQEVPRMKRPLTLGLGVLALGAGLVVAQAAFKAPTLKVPSEQVTLEFWTWVPGIEKTVALFEKAYPNVKVNVTNLGGGQSGTYPKLQTALKAGSGAPDLAQVEYGYIPFFAETGGLADLAKYGANDVKSYFVPWTWSQVSPDGQAVYAIPQDTGPFAMIYRKDLFDKYNVKVPTTWEEYAKAGEQLSKASGGKVKIGNFFSTYAPWFTALVWGAGGEMWERQGDTWVQTLNNPAAKKVATFWGDLIKKKYVSTYPAFTADFWNPVNKGEVATSMEAAWGPGSFAGSLGGLKDASKSAQYRVAPIPQWEKGRFVTGNWGGSSTVVTTQSKHPEAATAFAIWLNTSKDAIVANWNGGGLFPAADAGLGLQDLRDKSKNPSKFFGGQDVVTVYANASKAVNTKFAWAPWAPTVDASFAKQMDRAIKGQISYAAAIDAWQAETLAKAKADGYPVK
jgi:multiple sugar transport system substrate-binding protein